MAKQRIAYIDAMRGFTMILVVFAHVCHFCLGDSRMGYNSIFILFRLPCFFMLSGWLFAKYDFRHTGTVLYVSSEANYRGTVPIVRPRFIGLCFDFQKVPSVPVDPTDIPVNQVI